MLKTHLRISCEYSLRLALVGLFYFFVFYSKNILYLPTEKERR